MTGTNPARVLFSLNIASFPSEMKLSLNISVLVRADYKDGDVILALALECSGAQGVSDVLR